MSTHKLLTKRYNHGFITLFSTLPLSRVSFPFPVFKLLKPKDNDFKALYLDPSVAKNMLSLIRLNINKDYEKINLYVSWNRK